MATATPAARSWAPAPEVHARIRSPLHRLRGYIRLYVALEGLAVLLLAVALWFWVGLAADYGLFKLTSLEALGMPPVDWVQVAPRWGRALLVGVLLIAVLAVMLLYRRRRDIVRTAKHGRRHLPSFASVAASIGVLALAGLYAALWAGLGQWRDRGLPTGLTANLVGLLLALPALVLVARRLFYDFRDPALALVLERRFPAELGDRLITAVELADVEAASRLGYSPAMVAQTINEAADRVDKLPVQQAFHWKRLRRLALAVVLAVILPLVVVGLLFAAATGGFQGDRPSVVAHELADIGSIWFERNVLLENTIWPRRAMLELVGFPDNGELRIGRDAPPPSIRVRALKWVAAAPEAAEGWRPLAWNDLTADLLGEQPAPLPTAWNGVRSVWSVDQVENYLARDEVRQGLPADALLGLERTLEQLGDTVGRAGMNRRLRRLQVPDVVHVLYRGESMRSEMTLQRQGDHEYGGVFSDLKETIQFRARGEDYYTAPRQITVVPPPSLMSLTRAEDQPAYLYYRVPHNGAVADLKGKKQQFRGLPVSLTGETSRVDVPAGTDVVLTAKSDKPLERVRILPPKQGGTEVKARPELQADGATFITRFPNLRAPLDFVFEFVDTDNVVGLRHIVLKPLDDLAPEADVLPDVVRRTSQGHYLVTVNAHFPFSGRVRDDNGLEAIDYHHTLTKLEMGRPEQGGVVLPVLSATGQLAGGPQLLLPMATYLAAFAREAKKEDPREARQAPLGSFATKLRDREAEDRPTSAAVLAQALKTESPRRGRLLKEYQFDADDERSYFDLEPLRLKVDEDLQIQPRYRMQLWLVATDNDVETGPHTAPSREKFTFLLVSEQELLAEVGKEEEGLHLKLDDVMQRLREARGKLDQVSQDLSSLKDETGYGPLVVRTEEVEQVRERAMGSAAEVHSDYRRILKELTLNRVQEKVRKERVELAICDPLREALQDHFPKAETALADLHKALEAAGDPGARRTRSSAANDEAKKQLDRLIDRLNTILGSMEQLANITRLIRLAQEIRDEEQKQLDAVQKAYETFQAELLKGVLGDDIAPPKKDEKPMKKP